MTDIAENMFQAIDILIDKKISGISFDKTVTATILDDSEASIDKYLVEDGLAKYTAYSFGATYKKGDMVMVTIPQGNYDSQKIIIGKVKNSTQVSSNFYVSQLEKIINITGNVLTTDNSWFGYKVNDRFLYTWSTNIENFKDVLNPQSIWQQNFSNGLMGYRYLGFQADFSTELKNKGVIAGNFGVAIELIFNSIEHDINFSKFITFDSQEFFGDIFNLESYLTQSKVFDLKDFMNYPIVGIKIYPYQRMNFKDSSNNQFFSEENNLFIRNPYICFGEDLTNFTGDSLQLLTKSSSTYYKDLKENESIEDRELNNKKDIFIQWLHKNETTQQISQIKELPSGYEIRWYQYAAGEPSPDRYIGAHWKKIENTNNFSYSFSPDINSQTEQFKVIIIYGVEKIVESNIISFTNLSEVIDVKSLENIYALGIRIDDNKYNGKYLIYNRAGNLNKSTSGGPYRLIAVFDPAINSVYDKAELEILNSDNCQWLIPKSNLMIDLITEPSEEDDNYYIFNNITQIQYNLKNYLIHSNINNVIELYVEKDGIKYYSTIDLLFGTSGTSGSDYTLILDWLDKNSLDVNYKNDKITAQVVLLDSSGEKVNIDSADIACEWEVAQNNVYNEEEVEQERSFSSLEEAINFYIYQDLSTQVPNGEVQEKEFSLIYYPVFDLDYQTIDDIDYCFKEDRNNEYTYYIFNAETKQFELAPNETNQILYRTRISEIKDLVDQNIENRLTEDFLEETYNRIIESFQNEEEEEENNEEELLDNEEIFAEAEEENIFSFEEIKEKIINAYKDIVYNNAFIYNYFATLNNSEIKDKIIFEEINARYVPSRYFIKVNDVYVIDPWGKYNEAEVYYKPVLTNKIEINYLNTFYSIDNLNKQISIQNGLGNININSLYILKIILKNFGDYNLITYYPVPFTNGTIIKNIVGPTSVRYSTNGELDFYKNPYEAIPQNNAYRWRLIYKTNDNDSYLPILLEANKDFVDENYYSKPILQPVGIYLKEAPAYGIQIGFIEDDVFNPIYTQPILVYQDNYPSTTLNKWNGKDIKTDNNTGTIVASGFAAGRKELDNTFTGVVLGDWSRTDIDKTFANRVTGVFGFNHGAMSYALKDDGTAFLGKDGRGRIYLDGNKSYIYSSRWKEDQEGMLLNITSGEFMVKKGGNRVFISPDGGKGFFKIDAEYKENNITNSGTILNISNGDYYLQSINYSSELGSEAGTRLDIQNGKIISNNFLIEAKSNKNNQKIILSSDSDSKPLQIGNNFSIDWNSNIEAFGGSLTTDYIHIFNDPGPEQEESLSRARFGIVQGLSNGVKTRNIGIYSNKSLIFQTLESVKEEEQNNNEKNIALRAYGDIYLQAGNESKYLDTKFDDVSLSQNANTSIRISSSGIYFYRGLYFLLDPDQTTAIGYKDNESDEYVTITIKQLIDKIIELSSNENN